MKSHRDHFWGCTNGMLMVVVLITSFLLVGFCTSQQEQQQPQQPGEEGSNRPYSSSSSSPPPYSSSRPPHSSSSRPPYSSSPLPYPSSPPPYSSSRPPHSSSSRPSYSSSPPPYSSSPPPYSSSRPPPYLTISPPPLSVSSPSPLAPPSTSSSSSCINQLLPCFNYINDNGYGGNTKPSHSCCDPLKEMIKSNPECLCNMISIKGTNEAEKAGINVTSAQQLPARCGQRVNPISCLTSTGSPDSKNSLSNSASSFPYHNLVQAVTVLIISQGISFCMT